MYPPLTFADQRIKHVVEATILDKMLDKKPRSNIVQDTQPKRTSCSKSAAGLLLSSHQGDIRMRSQRLLRLDNNKSATSCQQACCKLIVKTLIHKLDVNCFNKQKLCKHQVASNSNVH